MNLILLRRKRPSKGLMAADGITILVVDDETIPRALRSLVLQKKGYRVVAAASGKEALERLAEGVFHLVLSDQMMPGMTGAELAKIIKSTLPAMPVVLISGVNEVSADATHADSFVSKTGGPDLLFNTIAEVLRAYGHGI